MKCAGATRSRTEDRATLESDPSADPEARMVGERERSPPPACQKPSWHQSVKLRGLGQSPRTYASARHPRTAHRPAPPGRDRIHGLPTHPSILSRPCPDPAVCTTHPGGEPEKSEGKYREKIGGKDRGALQETMTRTIPSALRCREPKSLGLISWRPVILTLLETSH